MSRINPYFCARVAGLVLILAGLGIYHTKALEWQKQEKQNQKEIDKVEAYNQKIEQGSQKEEKAAYKDGVYQGTAEGFGGEIQVSVTIADGAISKVEVIQAEKEDAAYLEMAMKMPERIIDAQTYEVDTVTGATYSSTGIKNATKEALEQAAP